MQLYNSEKTHAFNVKPIVELALDHEDSDGVKYLRAES